MVRTRPGLVGVDISSALPEPDATVHEILGTPFQSTTMTTVVLQHVDVAVANHFQAHVGGGGRGGPLVGERLAR